MRAAEEGEKKGVRRRGVEEPLVVDGGYGEDRKERKSWGGEKEGQGESVEEWER
jgi:hypothetical protein